MSSFSDFSFGYLKNTSYPKLKSKYNDFIQLASKTHEESYLYFTDIECVGSFFNSADEQSIYKMFEIFLKKYVDCKNNYSTNYSNTCSMIEETYKNYSGDLETLENIYKYILEASNNVFDEYTAEFNSKILLINEVIDNIDEYITSYEVAEKNYNSRKRQYNATEDKTVKEIAYSMMVDYSKNMTKYKANIALAMSNFETFLNELDVILEKGLKKYNAS